MIELRGITWDHPRGWGGLRAAAEAFRAERPNVRVTWEARTLQAFADQPVEQLAGRADLIVLDHPSIGEAVTAGAIRALDELLDGSFLDDQRWASVGRSFESYTWEGRQWALAIDAAAQVAAYRPDLLERAGASVPRAWDEVEALAAGVRVAIPAIPVDAICGFLGICCSLGTEPCATPDRVVEVDVGREALRILRGVVARSHPASTAWDPPTVLDHLARGDDLAYTPLAFGYVTHARVGSRGMRLRFGPSPSAGRGPSGTLGGAGLAISASTAHQEEAAAYAAFVASPAVQRGVYVEGGGQPGHREAWTDAALNDAVGGFFEATLPDLDAAYLRPRYDGFLGFQDDAGDIVHAFLRGERDDVDGVLADLDRRWRQSITARNGVA